MQVKNKQKLVFDYPIAVCIELCILKRDFLCFLFIFNFEHNIVYILSALKYMPTNYRSFALKKNENNQKIQTHVQYILK